MHAVSPYRSASSTDGKINCVDATRYSTASSCDTRPDSRAARHNDSCDDPSQRCDDTITDRHQHLRVHELQEAQGCTHKQIPNQPCEQAQHDTGKLNSITMRVQARTWQHGNEDQQLAQESNRVSHILLCEQLRLSLGSRFIYSAH